MIAISCLKCDSFSPQCLEKHPFRLVLFCHVLRSRLKFRKLSCCRLAVTARFSADVKLPSRGVTLLRIEKVGLGCFLLAVRGKNCPLLFTGRIASSSANSSMQTRFLMVANRMNVWDIEQYFEQIDVQNRLAVFRKRMGVEPPSRTMIEEQALTYHR